LDLSGHMRGQGGAAPTAREDANSDGLHISSAGF
jgi:hypothetical protein